MANPETPKATAPKTESPFPAFPSLPNFPQFDPMSMWTAGQQTFTKMMTDAVARWQSFSEQYAAIEQQVSTQAQGAVSHWAQLAKDAITYGSQLSAESRKLSIETVQKMGVGA